MLRYCRRNGLHAAARGQAHTVFGQSFVDAGLIVETNALNAVHQITADRADVDAGMLWKDLFAQAVARGVTPPIFTGYTALTVGGTLSVGGIGVAPREGAQVERVRQLQVRPMVGRVVSPCPPAGTNARNRLRRWFLNEPPSRNLVEGIPDLDYGHSRRKGRPLLGPALVVGADRQEAE